MKNDLQEKYKELCDDTTSVTDYLFGDDVKGKIKEMDVEFNIGMKVGKSHNRKHRGGFTGVQRKDRYPKTGHGRGGVKRRHDNTDFKQGNKRDDAFLEKRKRLNKSKMKKFQQ